MNNEQLKYYLALQKAEGIGDITAKKMITVCGSAEAVFAEKPQILLKIKGINRSVLKKLSDKKLFLDTENEIEFIRKNGITALNFLEDTYPERLKHCIDGPILLFQKGKIDFKKKRIISIVGTRNITNYGKSFLEEFISDLKKYDPVIISGLAYGVDIFTHRQAVKNNLQNIAVLAHGLDMIYPKVHQKDVEKILDNGGLMSDFPSNTNPDRENFVKRNRIVAGLSEATIVIESAVKGGSLITADLAQSYNRDIFAVPGRSTDLFSVGCNQLIKSNKASLLTSVKDLEYMLNWDLETPKKQSNIQKQLFVELKEEEQNIYDYLLKEGKHSLDLIALHCKFPIQKTATVLFSLEMKGVVKPLPGKLYEAV
jgi:DNA processing protein